MKFSNVIEKCFDVFGSYLKITFLLDSWILNINQIDTCLLVRIDDKLKYYDIYISERFNKDIIWIIVWLSRVSPNEHRKRFQGGY